MIKEYERDLTESEKRILKKQIEESKSRIPRELGMIFLKIFILTSFVLLIYYFPKIWLIIILSIISFFILWLLYYDIPLLVSRPKYLKKKQKNIENGIVRVNEINIDRYIKIANFEDEGNHFIVEYNGKLTLIGGQDFLGVRKLKNKIEQIEILDDERKFIYYDKVKKTGDSLNPFYVFKKGISDNLVESKIWEKLTNRNPFSGKLEDLNEFIEEDKRK
ncbi:hypothetical protein SAMN05421824_2996 [Hyunsoonleella jejuensis]|uniref:Uncharacterized protein n=1 Tax=Hyunsoonleella jejuensis TaxID=419940 RepID=A0A1H9L9T5_9FLAO|nr:hypothetical protein [Hyunsoonleella jejuensis]SER08164.1 hypothetical protein SAMN05421824_2996 [Hyunsoonleella jejuensis]